jgi:hypothetical protein
VTETDRIEANDGASARLERGPTGDTIAVRDRTGRVLFRYDPATGFGVLVAPEGDLRLCAPNGAIELVAAQGIRARAGGEVTLSSGTAASLAVDGPDATSRLRLDGSSIAVTSETLAVESSTGELRIRELRAFSQKLRAAIDDAEVEVDKLVRTAGRVIDRVDNFYQRVSELCEIKAGRLRTLVRGSWWTRGEDVTLLAKKDVRVDGEHIHLG